MKNYNNTAMIEHGKTRLIGFCALLLLAGAMRVGLAHADSAGSNFITFDMPGSVLTYPYSINQHGDIAGIYVDAKQFGHGFVRRYNDGKIDRIDPPGCKDTSINAINSDGIIMGGCFVPDESNYHFVRDASGNFTYSENNIQVKAINKDSFAGVTQSGLTGIRGTFAENKIVETVIKKAYFPEAMNSEGTITGRAYQQGSVQKSFVLKKGDTEPTVFEFPGAWYTSAQAINKAGDIAGVYNDATGAHVFVVTAADNKFKTLFDLEAESNTGVYCLNMSCMTLNDEGVVRGFAYYKQLGNNGLIRKGFVYEKGIVRTFEFPWKKVYPMSVNSDGIFTGYYVEYVQGHGFAHGFVYDSKTHTDPGNPAQRNPAWNAGR